MTLQPFLKRFCIEALAKLESMGELPCPRWRSPLIANELELTYPLSRLDSHAELLQFMRTSGVTQKLQEAGHTWFWHEEPFQWLFLERIIQDTDTRTKLFDATAFTRIYRQAMTEILRPHVRIRRITVINGLAQPARTLKIAPGLVLEPTEFKTAYRRLADLLRSRDLSRKVPTWIDSGSCFLIQDHVVDKRDDGHGLIEYWEEAQKQIEVVLTALRLTMQRPFMIAKAVYTSHLSNFPLLPIFHTEMEENRDISFSRQGRIRIAEERAIRALLRFLAIDDGTRTEAQFFRTALERFSSSFRVRQVNQNVVDLIVALESLFGVEQEELKRRLATNVALALGVRAVDRQSIYHKVSVGYRLRSAIVHGGRDGPRDLSRALTAFFPDSRERSGQNTDQLLWRALTDLREIVRKALRAYIHLATHTTTEQWPKAMDFESLQFNPKSLRELHNQQGVSPLRP